MMMKTEYCEKHKVPLMPNGLCWKCEDEMDKTVMPTIDDPLTPSPDSPTPDELGLQRIVEKYEQLQDANPRDHFIDDAILEYDQAFRAKYAALVKEREDSYRQVKRMHDVYMEERGARYDYEVKELHRELEKETEFHRSRELAQFETIQALRAQLAERDRDQSRIIGNQVAQLLALQAHVERLTSALTQIKERRPFPADHTDVYDWMDQAEKLIDAALASQPDLPLIEEVIQVLNDVRLQYPDDIVIRDRLLTRLNPRK